VKYWEAIADKLSKAGWSLGWVSAVSSEGRMIWVADAHRDDGPTLAKSSIWSHGLEKVILTRKPHPEARPFGAFKIGDGK
jgi:hypothetical protein